MAGPKQQKDPGAETAPNAYTRRELEALSKSTGIEVGTLWTMPRRMVQQKAGEAASAAAGLAQKEAERLAKVKGEKADAERPLSERQPWTQQLATGAGALAPLLLPFLTRRYSKDQRVIRAWDTAVDDAEKAQAAARSGRGLLSDATAAADKAVAMQKEYQSLPKQGAMKGLLKDAGAVGGGVLISTEAPVVPALIDKMTQNPGSRAYDEAGQKLNMTGLLDRLISSGPIMGGIAATGLKVGTIANRTPNIANARTNAIADQTRIDWDKGARTTGQNYAGAAEAELPAIAARRDVALARQAADNDVRLAETMPAKPRGLLAPDQSPMPAGPTGPQSPPPAAPAQSPSPPTPVAQPTLPEPMAQRQLMPPATGATGELPPAGPWAQNWSAPARQAIEEHISAGGNLTPRKGMTGDGLSEAIGRLTGGSRPSPSEARDRLSMLRNETGSSPDVDQVRKVWVRDKEGRLFAIPAALATGATGIGLLASGDPAEAGYYPDRGPRRGLLQGE